MSTINEGTDPWDRAAIASVPDDEEEEEEEEENEFSDHVLPEESWSITKRDRPISNESAIRVMDRAHIVLRKRLSEATEEVDIFKFETSLARFQNSELELGKRLAWGNFADIYLVKSFQKCKTAKSCTQDQDGAAEEVKRTCTPGELVVKVLRSQLLGNTALYATGAADVATEGTLLASLDHPHIVAIKGRSVASVEGFASGRRDAFFLVLERLHGTLTDRVKEWQERATNNRALTKGIKGRRDCRAEILRERIAIMVELADAMAYLHERNIIHRDLKLSNVGIDVHGKIKLVDFGLAKILPPHISDKETFLLTGNTGSVRYMAPEVGRGQKYNLKADVYSFSILLFEVLNLEKVWNGLQPHGIREKVFHRKQRPRISVFWPAPLKDLLKSTWSDIPNARLSMKHVHTVLQKQANDMSSCRSDQQ